MFGGEFLAESSFLRPCLLLRDTGPHLAAAAEESALAQETLGESRSVPDSFLHPGWCEPAQNTHNSNYFTERKVVYKTEWKYGWDTICSGLLAQTYLNQWFLPTSNFPLLSSKVVNKVSKSLLGSECTG